jgi:hypothetical protein
MFRIMRIAGLATAVLLLTRLSLDACGDKLLVLGRGVRFQNETAEYPASILHYMTARNFDPATLTDSNLQSFLGRAGHKLRSVRTAKELAEALRSGRYDIVVINVEEAPAFEEMIKSAPSKPLLLPFVYNGKKADVTAAKRRYGAVLKAPAKEEHWLETLDDAMELREKLQRKANKELN